MIRAAPLALLTLAAPVWAETGHRILSVEVAHRDVGLDVHLGYPAAPGAEPEWIGRTALFHGHRVRPDAPAATEDPLPLVLLSHGSGGNAVAMGWLAGELAEQGMIVAAPNHPGTTSGDSVPALTVRPWERAWDTTALLDHLLASPPGGLAIDPDAIAAVGFSLGGHTALRLEGARVSKDAFVAYCDGNDVLDCGWFAEAGLDLGSIDARLYEASDRDGRIAVAVDPALAQAYVPESLAGIDAPLLVVNLGAGGAVPEGVAGGPIAAAAPNGRHRAIEGAVHFSVLARCRPLGRIVIGLAEDEPICADPVRPRAEVHEELTALIGDFLRAALPPPAR